MFGGEIDRLTAQGRGVDPVNRCFAFKGVTRVASERRFAAHGIEEIFEVRLVGWL
jgi:hypothetical protein